MNVAVTGLAVASALGQSLEEHLAAIDVGRSGLRPLGEFPDGKLPFPKLLAGWIPDRSWLAGRRYGAASNAAIKAAQIAANDARWKSNDLAGAWLYVGSSRGNAGELLRAWKQRRPVRKFAASNTMHSEIGAAVSIELGIKGPWQVFSNGCSSGLDAIGHAWLAVANGLAPRALVVSVDLPLLSELLEDFDSTGLLSRDNTMDPHDPETSGFFPAEAVAALCLEPSKLSHPRLLGYAANSDAYDSLAVPEDGGGLTDLLRSIQSSPQLTGWKIGAICPHANGTAAHRSAELRALREAIPGCSALYLLKPFVGHSLGASGALEAAILCGYLRGATSSKRPQSMLRDLTHEECVLKIAVGMGGHNAVIALATSSPTRRNPTAPAG